MAIERCELWVQLLEFDPHKLFDMVNKNLVDKLNTWPHDDAWIYVALDESMIPWKSSKHKWIVCIPRKPHPNGMRVYILANILTQK